MIIRLSLQCVVEIVGREFQVTICRRTRVLSTPQKQLEHLYDLIAQAGAQLAWEQPKARSHMGGKVEAG